ncbi:MAG: adenosylcobinamide-GDP ribazoletransferase, partial [Pseudomonadota bacterium]
MTKNDPASDPAHDTALIQTSDLTRALALLTRLPVSVGQTERDAARAAWAYPIVGLFPAALSGLIGSLAMTLGLGAAIASILALGTGAIVTGALHEDGLADCADGFWGAWTTKRRLEIMRDSRIGAYGVLTLIVTFAMRWAALSALFETDLGVAALLAAGAISRASMPALMTFLPPARPGGLSHHVGRPPLASTALALAITTVIALFILGHAAPAVLFG